MANSSSPATAFKTRKFKDFPIAVQKRMTIAHRIALIYRLKTEPFQKVAKSCLPEDDDYVASFKEVDPAVLEAELKRLRGLRK